MVSIAGAAILSALHAIAQPSAETDTALANELVAAAESVRDELPIRQNTPNGTVTIEAMVARANQLITTMSVPADLSSATFSQEFEAQLPGQVCGNPVLRALVARGAVISYIVLDRGRERFTASVRSCANVRGPSSED